MGIDGRCVSKGTSASLLGSGGGGGGWKVLTGGTRGAGVWIAEVLEVVVTDLERNRGGGRGGGGGIADAEGEAFGSNCSGFENDTASDVGTDGEV